MVETLPVELLQRIFVHVIDGEDGDRLFFQVLPNVSMRWREIAAHLRPVLHFNWAIVKPGKNSRPICQVGGIGINALARKFDRSSIMELNLCRRLSARGLSISLHTIASRLTSLTLDSCGYAFGDHSLITLSHFCPNIQELVVKNCSYSKFPKPTTYALFFEKCLKLERFIVPQQRRGEGHFPSFSGLKSLQDLDIIFPLIGSHFSDMPSVQRCRLYWGADDAFAKLPNLTALEIGNIDSFWATHVRQLFSLPHLVSSCRWIRHLSLQVQISASESLATIAELPLETLLIHELSVSESDVLRFATACSKLNLMCWGLPTRSKALHKQMMKIRGGVRGCDGYMKCPGRLCMCCVRPVCFI